MQAMKPKYIPSNSNYKKKFFKCNNCGFLCIKNVPQNIKPIKCDKCPNILTEISEREYQTRFFMYVNNNQTNLHKLLFSFHKLFSKERGAHDADRRAMQIV